MAEVRKGKKRGQIGAQIFAQVERLVADQKLSRAHAFKRVAQKTGRKEGTVSANYYRVARSRGVALRRRGGAGASKSTLVTRILRTIEALAELIRQQEAELVHLRQENRRFAAIRKLVGKA